MLHDQQRFVPAERQDEAALPSAYTSTCLNRALEVPCSSLYVSQAYLEEGAFDILFGCARGNAKSIIV